MPTEIRKVSKRYMKEPVEVTIGKVNATNKSIDHQYYVTSAQYRYETLKRIIDFNPGIYGIIFTRTKADAQDVSARLTREGYDIDAIHGDLTQQQRDRVMGQFRDKTLQLLIATDVASRGLHIDDVDLVINYDLSLDEKIHTHRIGRTARAGKGGLAISLYTRNDFDRVEVIKDTFSDIQECGIENVEDDLTYKIDSDLRTIFINGGKKQKLRAGDILGALTAGIGLQKDDIGKITILDFASYVAIKKDVVEDTIKKLSNEKIKGKLYRIYLK
jgi:superfamily II DNA/RNA helicase